MDQLKSLIQISSRIIILDGSKLCEFNSAYIIQYDVFTFYFAIFVTRFYDLTTNFSTDAFIIKCAGEPNEVCKEYY